MTKSSEKKSDQEKSIYAGLSEAEKKVKVAEHNAIIRKMTDQRIKGFLITAGITILYIAIFGGLGWYLDLLYKTKPIMMFVGLAFSYVITQITIAKVLNQLTSKKHD